MPYFDYGGLNASSTDQLIFARIVDDVIYGVLIGIVIGIVFLALKGRNKKPTL